MSRQRDKGTAFEVEVLEQLRGVWPDIARRGTTLGNQDAGDYLNTGPVLIEAKKVDKPTFFQWARTCRKKAAHGRWLIYWAGDRRTEDGQPLVCFPPEFAIDLLHAYFGPAGFERAQARHQRDQHIAATLAAGERNPTFTTPQPTIGDDTP